MTTIRIVTLATASPHFNFAAPCLDHKTSDDEKTDDEGYNDDMKLSSNNNNIPGFSQFLYFLFAPTLVYRDSYPQ